MIALMSKPAGRAEPQHQAAAHRRTEQNPQLPACRVEPHRARQIFGADDVMNQQLLGRRPENAGDAVNHEQHAGVPNLETIREKENCPSDRDRHIHQLRNLNQLAAIVAIGQSRRSKQTARETASSD